MRNANATAQQFAHRRTVDAREFLDLAASTSRAGDRTSRVTASVTATITSARLSLRHQRRRGFRDTLRTRMSRRRPQESVSAAPTTATNLRSPTRTDFWLDGLGFALGVGYAWWVGWRVAELLWSLWLSSLVFGGVWMLLTVLRARARDADTRLSSLRSMQASLLLFTALHFGGIHFVHSLFLIIFFPLLPPGFGFGEHYLQVLRACFPWLLAMACAEHRVLANVPVVRLARTTADRARRPQNLFGLDPLAAYRNVMRMHLLLIAAIPLVHAGVPSVVIYLLVYTVYFWPRRWWTAAAER